MVSDTYYTNNNSNICFTVTAMFGKNIAVATFAHTIIYRLIAMVFIVVATLA